VTDSVQLLGLANVEERLGLLDKVAGQKAMRGALFAATKPILEQARANVRAWPSGSGALYMAMGRTFRVSARGGGVVAQESGAGSRFAMSVGPRLKVPAAVALYNLAYKRKRKGIFYGHLLEWGHRIGTRRTGRLQRKPGAKGHVGLGRVPSHPFLRRALDNAGLRAAFVFQKQIGLRVERALRKQSPEGNV
jgi:hypothetical protein